MTETNKRNPTNGFDEKSMESRIGKIKKYSASWRRVEQRKVVMTTLEQTFRHTSSGKESTVSHICPWGM